MDKNGVAVAFDIVLEEIDSKISALRDRGAKAIHSGAYNESQELTTKAVQMEGFRNRVNDLRQEWLRAFADTPSKSGPTGQRRRTRRVSERLPRGLASPWTSFQAPILEVLVELGGSGRAADVLDRVGEKLEAVLNPHDRELLQGGTIRWRNSTRWARKVMVEEGLLANNSPIGIWEITPAGREWLARLRRPTA